MRAWTWSSLAGGAAVASWRWGCWWRVRMGVRRAAGAAVLSASAAEGAERSGWDPGPMPCMLTVMPVASWSPAHNVKHMFAT